MRNTRVLLAAMGGIALATSLIACAPAEPETPGDTASETADDTDAEDGGDAAAPGDGPAWALPTTTPGTQIATITGDGFQVDVYQVGTTEATKTGQFMTPEGAPVIAVGDEIVFVNYVITNTSGADILLPFNLVNVEATYASWPYLQGMDSVVDSALYEQMEVNSSAFALGATESPFVWPAGSTFSYGTNFLYEAGGAITFEAILTPATDAGDLDHDNRQEAAAESAIS